MYLHLAPGSRTPANKMVILGAERLAAIAKLLIPLKEVKITSLIPLLKYTWKCDDGAVSSKNFVRHFQGTDIKCKLPLSTNNLAFLSLLSF
jgi:hypothetical protein